ncbi:helix-turn-helix domain-containing protein [Methanocaldococcus fervens]|uniref:Transcriptional regulator, LysR family n=1 Tax=Methanocaldococcus fervens (strain DSM 4213 / JCM 15782 / AG86) TaxID=573064 RepID=C7P6F2_METFA|nr:LysR family transcriptional regulator [Methanocaldococcus fervens]ACV24134.1 transcriptional regulator, LysR family [Methanocaldococcus fervens AG86]
MDVDLVVEYKGKLITPNQIKLLIALHKTKSQNEASKLLNISPSSFNIQLKRLEDKLGDKLYYSSPNGTILTDTGLEILETYNLYKKRLKKHFFIVSGFVSGEIAKVLFENPIITSFDNALELLKMGFVDVLGVDDSYWIYRLGDERFLKSEVGGSDFNIFLIAYDNFVMVSKKEFDYKNLVGIRFSSQRIVYNILKKEGIRFKVKVRVKNPFRAIELVDEGYSLFLNESFLRYVDDDFNITYPKFYEKTVHAINFISFGKDVKIDKKEIKKIKKLGFKYESF